jgi:hypothetical protein
LAFLPITLLGAPIPPSVAVRSVGPYVMYLGWAGSHTITATPYATTVSSAQATVILSG